MRRMTALLLALATGAIVVAMAAAFAWLQSSGFLV
jgi:DNA-binding transcriptional regulator of glucitol operon